MKKALIRTAAVLAAVPLLSAAALKAFIAREEKRRADVPGNDEIYDVKNQPKHPDSILNGRKILFLGSSVTYGAASEGQSFVDLFAQLDGVSAVKEAVSGTTLADIYSPRALLLFGSGASYVSRLKRLPGDLNPDCVVCQLSTNDASKKLPLGDIAADADITSFDRRTITGAIEFILAYCRDRWHCPVVFYTGSYYESEEYQAMVSRLYELKDKWHFNIIDLYTDEEFNTIDRETYDLYMFDPIHPTKAGYLKWWMPKMEADLIRFLQQQA